MNNILTKALESLTNLKMTMEYSVPSDISSEYVNPISKRINSIIGATEPIVTKYKDDFSSWTDMDFAKFSALSQEDLEEKSVLVIDILYIEANGASDNDVGQVKFLNTDEASANTALSVLSPMYYYDHNAKTITNIITSGSKSSSNAKELVRSHGISFANSTFVIMDSIDEEEDIDDLDEELTESTNSDNILKFATQPIGLANEHLNAFSDIYGVNGEYARSAMSEIDSIVNTFLDTESLRDLDTSITNNPMTSEEFFNLGEHMIVLAPWVFSPEFGYTYGDSLDGNITLSEDEEIFMLPMVILSNGHIPDSESSFIEVTPCYSNQISVDKVEEYLNSNLGKLIIHSR